MVWSRIAGKYVTELYSPRLVGFLLTHFNMIGLLAPWAWVEALEPVALEATGPLQLEKTTAYISLWTTTLDDFTTSKDESVWQTLRVVVPIALVMNIIEYLGINVIDRSDFIVGAHHAFLAFVNSIAVIMLFLALVLYAARVDDMFAHLTSYDESVFGPISVGLQTSYYLAGPVSLIITICLNVVLMGYHFFSWSRADM
jgi:hypothetical protein